MSSKTKIPESKHFQLEELAEGVYAAISSENGWAISNAGIVDLGGRALVFDTFMTPQAGSDLRQAAETLTGRKVSTVINSHYHNDHIWGNQAFLPEADIISTVKTRHLISTAGMDEYRSYRENSAPRLKTLEADYRVEQDEVKRQRIFRWISYYEGIVKSFPKLEIILPTLTFDKRLELHGSKRQAELIAFPGGHTASDAVLFLPAERIIFMSDLLFVGNHPYLADGDPEEWNRSLEEVSLLEATTFVPGHGPVGTRPDLKMMKQYINDIEKLARRALESGKTEEKLAKTSIPKAYSGWDLPQFFPVNLRFAYHRLAQQVDVIT